MCMSTNARPHASAGTKGGEAPHANDKLHAVPISSKRRVRLHASKNVKTLWREAEKLIGEDGALQMVDPLYVIETCMRYFYSLAQTGRKANAPLDEVRKCFEKAAYLAALAAPYRHPRLSA